MKYIRTKDGIIDLDKYVLFQENDDMYILKSKKHRKNGQNFSILFKKYVIKQADTIEELCDEFALHYLEYQDRCNIPWATYERRGVWEKEREHIVKEMINHPSYRQPVLYAAVWTSKGLIYVAKMKGVLPNGEIDWELL